MASLRVLIAGAGLIGLFTAWSLRRAGVEVTLFERGRPGREASWAGGGILSPLYPWRYPAPVWTLAEWSMRRYPELIEALGRRTREDVQYQRSGLVILDQVETADALSWSRGQGRAVAQWSAEKLRRQIPAIGDYPGAVALPWAGQVRTPRLARALASAVVAEGAVLRTDEPVQALLWDGARVTGVRTATDRHYADAVVVAAGAWSSALAGRSVSLPVTPVKGQMLLLGGCRDLLNHIVLHRGRYLIPRREGKVLVGSTLERSGFDQATTATARARLHAAASGMIPRLGECPVLRHWAGLRPATPGGVPVIGPHPEIAGLYVNTGHYRNGVVAAPASGRLMADLVLGRAPLVDPTAYAWPV